MSHTEGNSLGFEHGKIGDRIASVINGKQIYKGLYKPKNPRTPKQQMHRAKIAFVNRLSKDLAEAVNAGFATVPEAGSGQSPRNAFVKENWDNGSLVWLEREEENVGVDASGLSQGNGTSAGELFGEWAICPERLRLASGPRYIGRGIAANAVGKADGAPCDRRLIVTCPDLGMDNSHSVDDDQLMVAVYRPAVPTVHLFPGPLRKDCRECCRASGTGKSQRLSWQFPLSTLATHLFLPCNSFSTLVLPLCYPLSTSELPLAYPRVTLELP